jgi:hypothetical protein
MPIRAYCEKFDFTYVEAPNSPLDAEGWEGVECAAFEGLPAQELAVVILMTDLTCKIMVQIADGERFLEDCWENIDSLPGDQTRNDDVQSS